MGRTFSGATDRVDFGSGASLDDVNVFTSATWINVTTVAATRVLYTKGGSGGKRFRLFGGTSSGSMQLTVSQATTIGTAQSAASTVTTGAWQFLAATFDGSFVPRLYRAALGAPVTEVSYAVQTTGIGGISSDASQSMLFGGDASNSLPGTAAEALILPAALNAGQLTTLAYGMLPRECRLYAPLYGVASTEPDYSGNKNNGTLTGTAAGAHPPIRSRWAGLVSGAPDRTVSVGGGGSDAFHLIPEGLAFNPLRGLY
jgi:hypothetical protein